MMVVVADDFTGAAELAAIGLQAGLHTTLTTTVDVHSEAQLMVVATDTRSMSRTDAVTQVTKITGEVLKLQPALIFKKVDSVLRGHVLPELLVQQQMLQQGRVLLVTANPHLGRRIYNGAYFLHNRPIHESSFAADPEFPITSSSIAVMLGPMAGNAVQVVPVGQVTPGSGIIVGEVQRQEHLDHWAKVGVNDRLVAGAAGFFSALLQQKGWVIGSVNEAIIGLEQPVLYVSGTAFGKSQQAVAAIHEQGGPVAYLPPELATGSTNKDELLSSWCSRVITLLTTHRQAIVAVAPGGGYLNAEHLRNLTAELVARVVKQHTPKELVIEGGSTAAACFNRLHYTSFLPTNELAPGVIRMQPVANRRMHITVKPGSYNWPHPIWNF